MVMGQQPLTASNTKFSLMFFNIYFLLQKNKKNTKKKKKKKNWKNFELTIDSSTDKY